MTKRIMGMAFFSILAVLIMGYDQRVLIDGRSLVAVLMGTLILTLSQLNRRKSMNEIIQLARWNAFFSGLLTTLLSTLAFVTGAVSREADYITASIPLLYGSVLFLAFELASEKQAKSGEIAPLKPEGLNIQHASAVLTAHGFSPREVHVALKILEGCANKEIASQLYISEATVKKHIQNMFRKCGAEDRTSFTALYHLWSGDQNYDDC